MSQPELLEMKKQVAAFLEQGIIEPSSSPYAAPVLFVKKKSEQLRAAYAADEAFASTVDQYDLDKHGLYRTKGKNQIVVPHCPDLKARILVEMHDAQFAGHVGITKTLERISRIFWWPRMRSEVRHYSDWPFFLSLAEFAVNNSWQESIQSTPFLVNTGQSPLTPALLELPGEVYCPSARKLSEWWQSNVKQARHFMEQAQQRQAYLANKGRRDVEFSPGQLVLLSTKNLRLKPGTRPPSGDAMLLLSGRPTRGEAPPFQPHDSLLWLRLRVAYLGAVWLLRSSGAATTLQPQQVARRVVEEVISTLTTAVKRDWHRVGRDIRVGLCGAVPSTWFKGKDPELDAAHFDQLWPEASGPTHPPLHTRSPRGGKPGLAMQRPGVAARFLAVTLNVQGLAQPHKVQALLDWAAESPAQVVFIQECHRAESVWQWAEAQSGAKPAWRGQWFYTSGTGSSQGCLVLVKPSTIQAMAVNRFVAASDLP
ncbi:hypothetical protein QJQ45_013613 [Haematococcus lacustris]|nr:hypothetical protein QJQ45_013613 [Haematococcus lacustris]